MKKKIINLLIFISFFVLLLDSSTYTGFSYIYKDALRLVSLAITVFVIITYRIARDFICQKKSWFG